MAILLLFLAFICIFQYSHLFSPTAWRATLMKTVIVFSTICLLFIEGHSYFYSLNYSSLLGSWSLVILMTGFLIYRKQQKTGVPLFKPKWATFKNLSLFEKRISYVLIGFMAIIFSLALIYPPNNWDSLSYHLVRIVHWISNESVAHYPALDYRQIHQAPFGEYLITHFIILYGNDLLANSVQWFFLFFILVGGSLFGKKLGLSRKYQLLTAFFIITIPQVIMQASSTKNDLVACYYLMTAAWFMLQYVEKQTFLNFLFIGLSIGLGTLTKSTVYLFFSPILFCFAYWFLKNSFTTRNWSNFGMAVPIGLLVLLINAGHSYRNYAISGNVLGTSAGVENGYSVVGKNIPNIFSNTIKNISLHLAPFPLSRGSEWTIRKIHDVFNLDVNNPQTTFGFTKYKVTNYPNGEGDSPNLLHLLFLTIASVYAFRKVNRKQVLIPMLAGIVLCQFFLFCGYLKWQPWHTRLHLPVFILGAPLISLFFQHRLKGKIGNILLAGFVFYASASLLLNNARPIVAIKNVTSDISIFDNRYKKLFVARPYFEKNYRTIIEIFKKRNFQNVVIMSGIELEYSLLHKIVQGEVKAYNLDANNYSEKIKQALPNTPDCLISRVKEEKINFQGKAYYNLNPTSEHLFLYARTSDE